MSASLIADDSGGGWSRASMSSTSDADSATPCASLAAGGEGLGACWGVEKACDYLSAAGFVSVDTFTVDGNPLNMYFRCVP